MAISFSRMNQTSNPSYVGRVSLGSILCGSFVTGAVGLLFLFLGLGLDISLLGTEIDGALSFGTWMFTFGAFLISFFSGGFVAGHIAQIESSFVAALHGISAWAVSTVSLVTFASMFNVALGFILINSNWLTFVALSFGGIAAVLGAAIPTNRRSKVQPVTTEHPIEQKRAA